MKQKFSLLGLFVIFLGAILLGLYIQWFLKVQRNETVNIPIPRSDSVSKKEGTWL